MADEDKPSVPEVAAGSNEKMFSGKGLIVFIATIALYTIALLYILNGGKDNPGATEGGGQSIDDLKIYEKLLRDESEIPKFIVDKIVVNIKLDKSGDTTKKLLVSLAFSLGFTKNEKKAINDRNWKRLEPEMTKFGNKIEYSEDFNIIAEVIGVGDKPLENEKSYLRYLKNKENEIRARVNQKLRNITYNELNNTDGQNNIAQSLQSDVNEMLYELGFYKRVNKISWITFTFQ